MKQLVLTCILFSLAMASQAQQRDLIVSVNNDSIACTIDSLTEAHIYFTAERDRRTLSSHIALSQVATYQYGVIDPEGIEPIRGTIYFRTLGPGERDLARNAISGLVGHALIAGSLNLNYEAMMGNRPTGLYRSLWLRSTGGYFATWGDEGFLLAVTFVGLTGSKNHHFETGLGFSIFVAEPQVLPNFGLGYRYQKPQGGMVFRTGLSFPEGFYLGLGFSF